MGVVTRDSPRAMLEVLAAIRWRAARNDYPSGAESQPSIERHRHTLDDVTRNHREWAADRDISYPSAGPARDLRSILTPAVGSVMFYPHCCWYGDQLSLDANRRGDRNEGRVPP